MPMHLNTDVACSCSFLRDLLLWLVAVAYRLWVVAINLAEDLPEQSACTQRLSTSTCTCWPVFVQTPDELERRNDSYNLALKQRGVTLKPWSSQHAGQQDSGHAQNSPDLPDPSLDVVSDGQVLEGQGRGQFLGPPAQRWAIGSALKDSINRWLRTDSFFPAGLAPGKQCPIFVAIIISISHLVCLLQLT